MQWPELEFWRQTMIKHCAATKHSLDTFEATRDRSSVFHLLCFTRSGLQRDLLLPWQEGPKSLLFSAINHSTLVLCYLPEFPPLVPTLFRMSLLHHCRWFTLGLYLTLSDLSSVSCHLFTLKYKDFSSWISPSDLINRVRLIY